MLMRSYQHKGSSFLEIYQNCNIFNDGAFEIFTEKIPKPKKLYSSNMESPWFSVPRKIKGSDWMVLNR